MTHLSQEELRRHVRTYLVVFVALALLTAVTVMVSYLHLPLRKALLVALAIAVVKGSLVAGFFMHLISEKQVIFLILIFTALFFLVLLTLPVISA